MGDLENLNALKRMLEHKDEQEAKELKEKEQRFLQDATRAYLGETSDVSTIKGYEPDRILEFLSGPANAVKSRMGGEWALMDKDAFEAFTYTMVKKIQKSTTLLDWKS